jgi:hypothetical protein
MALPDPAFGGPLPGSLDLDAEIRAWLVAALKRSRFSRAITAARVGELVGRPDLSQAVVDAWCAESKEKHRIPAAYLPALCLVLDDFGGLRILARAAGRDLVEPHEMGLLEIARLEAEQARIAAEIARRRGAAGRGAR